MEAMLTRDDRSHLDLLAEHVHGAFVHGLGTTEVQVRHESGETTTHSLDELAVLAIDALTPVLTTTDVALRTELLYARGLLAPPLVGAAERP